MPRCSALSGFASLSSLHFLFPLCFCRILCVGGSESLGLLINVSFFFKLPIGSGFSFPWPGESYVLDPSRRIQEESPRTCRQIKPAPYMMLLIEEGRTSLGMRPSEEMSMKFRRKVKWKTWKKFIIRRRRKFFWVRICLI